MQTERSRVAVVTGGNRGIGFEIAKRFVSEGYKVAIIGRDRCLAIDKAGSIGKNCIGFGCDLKNIAQIEKVVDEIISEFGSIDVLVNNAGILDTSTIDDTTEKQWDDVLDTNLKGAYFMIQKAIPYLKQGISPRIINIASNAGRMGGYENGLAYSASKGGLIAVTYGAARRLAPYGITVNCVSPGTIVTDMVDRGYDEETQRRLKDRFPIGRMGRPQEVADAVSYFASIEASFTTGAVLDVNGGMFMG